MHRNFRKFVKPLADKNLIVTCEKILPQCVQYICNSRRRIVNPQPAAAQVGFIPRRGCSLSAARAVEMLPKSAPITYPLQPAEKISDCRRATTTPPQLVRK